MYKEKLIIGTANFGRKYNGHKVPNSELADIWEYCIDKGIEQADCATAYEYTPPKHMKCINKITKETDEISRYANLIHHTEDVPKLWPMLWQFKLMSVVQGYPMKIGVSIYDLNELTCLPYDIVQLPYSLAIAKPELLIKLKARGIETHIRKVFPVKKADDFYKYYKDALKNPLIDKVVIGIDNLANLQGNFQIAESLHADT